MADLDEKLKPCPYCGGCCAKIVPIRDGYRAHCTKCGAAGGAEFYGPGDKPSARERAITAWNRRATQAQAPDVVEALRNAIDAEHAKVSGDDGYNYAAGQEYGLRQALMVVDAALASLSPAKGSEGGAK